MTDRDRNNTIRIIFFLNVHVQLAADWCCTDTEHKHDPCIPHIQLAGWGLRSRGASLAGETAKATGSIFVSCILIIRERDGEVCRGVVVTGWRVFDVFGLRHYCLDISD